MSTPRLVHKAPAIKSRPSHPTTEIYIATPSAAEVYHPGSRKYYAHTQDACRPPAVIAASPPETAWPHKLCGRKPLTTLALYDKKSHHADSCWRHPCNKCQRALPKPKFVKTMIKCHFHSFFLVNCFHAHYVHWLLKHPVCHSTKKLRCHALQLVEQPTKYTIFCLNTGIYPDSTPKTIISFFLCEFYLRNPNSSKISL